MSDNTAIHLCPLCLFPLLDDLGRAIPCACDEAERRGIRLPDDRYMTECGFKLAVTDYRHRLFELGLIR